MRRFISAIAFLAALVIVLGAAGCGARFEGGATDAPAPGDLAADALEALAAQGSAHFVAEVRTTLAGYSEAAPFTLHVEGDASADALDVEGRLGSGAFSVTGHVLADEHNLFIQFMDRWYGERQGIADALAEARKDRNGSSPWEDWSTPDGLRENFGELFTGTVSAGPVVDGVETWRFEGRLDADGLALFGRRYGEATLPEVNEKTSRASRLVLIVGRDDHLPRRGEFSVKLSPEDLEALLNDGAANYEMTLDLSEFGKPVTVTAPGDFEPLDALFQRLFSGLE